MLRADKAEQTLDARAICACASLTLLLLSTHLLNAELFPRVAQVFPAGRELSTYSGVGIAVAIAIAAYRRPGILHVRGFSLTCLVVLATGMAAMLTGLVSGNPAPIALGSPLGGISAWFFVLAGVALAKSGLQASMVVIPTAFMACYCMKGLLAIAAPDLPDAAAAMTYLACVTGSYLLARPAASELFGNLRRVPAPTDLDITHPVSFLPLSSFVFVTIAVFSAACGFALADAHIEAGSASVAGIAACAPMTFLFLIAAVLRRRLSADTLHSVSFLLVCGALSSMPLVLLDAGGSIVQGASSALMTAGSDCFTLLTYVLISAVGARNPLAALVTSSIAIAAEWLGIGCGALIVQFTQGIFAGRSSAVACAATIASVAFVAYNTYVSKHHSFCAAIDAIRPISPAEAAALGSDDATPGSLPAEEHSEADAFADCCAAVSQEFGLTNREADVLALLARGRTAPVIQEKLVLSHNTVKTHVRHIYAKTGVHSQQELIDIVESGAAER